MKKKVLFFNQKPPKDKTAIHIWLGKGELSHDEHLSQILKQYLGVSSFKIATNSKGKRHLPGFPLHFNLSDSEDWLAIALSWEAPVGIDIESIRSIDGMDQIIDDCFSPSEQAYVRSSEKGSLSRFWEIWSRKEACLKARGIGLQDHMKRWDCHGEDWIFVNKTWVKSLQVERHLAAAVAIHKRQGEI